MGQLKAQLKYKRMMDLDDPSQRAWENLLYPQYEDVFTKIPSQVWFELVEEARKLITESSNDASECVIRHWKAIAAGKVPFGLQIDYSKKPKEIEL